MSFFSDNLNQQCTFKRRVSLGVYEPAVIIPCRHEREVGGKLPSTGPRRGVYADVHVYYTDTGNIKAGDLLDDMCIDKIKPMVDLDGETIGYKVTAIKTALNAYFQRRIWCAAREGSTPFSFMAMLIPARGEVDAEHYGIDLNCNLLVVADLAEVQGRDINSGSWFWVRDTAPAEGYVDKDGPTHKAADVQVSSDGLYAEIALNQREEYNPLQ